MPGPDVFWILTTQWRGQSIGWAGDPDARTPHLDRAASNGVVVDQAVACHPFGPFSRASLLTGRRSEQVGIRDYFDPLPAGTPTVADAFSVAGYETAWFGKWHLGPKLRDAPPVGEAQARRVVPPDQRGGFHWWEGFEGGFLNCDPWIHGSGQAEPKKAPGYQPDVLVDRLLGFLGRRRSEQPLFAVLSVEPPHPPYGALPHDIEGPRPDTVHLRPNVPRGGAEEMRARQELCPYLGQIEGTDRALGRLLEAISERGRPHLFVFTSVHGDMHGSHGLFRKGWPYEESIRVPLLFLSPEQLKPALRTDGVFSLIDLAATSLEMAGVGGSEGVMGGRGRGDWIHGRRSGPEAVAIGMPSVPPFPPNCPMKWEGVRTQDAMAVWHADGTPWLAFDLEADPYQQCPVVDGSLHRRLDRVRRELI